MPRRLLIVEDDPLVAMMLESYFEVLGIETAGSAEDVAGALFHVENLQFDAAILDLNLANGETSEPVAIALAAANIPFVLTTGSGVDGGAAFGSAPRLAKPFTMSMLEAAIDRL